MRARTLLAILLILTVFGCGDKSRGPRTGSTEFSDSGQNSPPKAETNTQTDANGEPIKPIETANPTPVQIQRQLELDTDMHKENKEAGVQIYQTSTVIRDRLREARPELVIVSSKHFSISDPFLDISSKSATFTFKGTLKVTGKPDEKIDMYCHFDKSKTPWSCNNMYPLDPKIAAQRRLQATVNCADIYRWELDSYPCEDVGIEIFVVVNGKTESQLFQTRKFSVRIATSGDEEVEEHKTGLKPLLNPVPAGPPIQQKPAEAELEAINPISAERPKPKPGVTEDPLTEIQPISAERPKPTVPEEQVTFAPPPVPENFDDQPIIFAPPPDEAEELSDSEIADVIDDPNIALEITAPIPQPEPDNGPQSIPGIATLRPALGSNVPNQAHGSHNNGRLENASGLPANGPGFKSRSHGSKDFGAEIMISLLKGAAANVNTLVSGAHPIIVGGIAKRTGGCLTTVSGRCHSSHRNGLDADVAFPSAKRTSDLWSACEAIEQTRQVRRMGKMQNRKGTFCRIGGAISSDFDTKRFWEFVKSIAGARGEPVIAMFLDPEIKKHMCRYAKSKEDITNKESAAYKALRAMKDEPGHYNHVHIRVRCPGNAGCRGQDSIVTLGNGTGC